MTACWGTQARVAVMETPLGCRDTRGCNELEHVPNLPMPTEETVIYGAGSTERIVGVEPHEGRVVVWRRPEEGGEAVREIRDFHPCVWLASGEGGRAAEMLQRDLRGLQGAYDLAGDLYYDRLLVLHDIDTFWTAYRHLSHHATGEDRLPGWCYAPTDMQQQWMMQSGETMFGGMRPSDLRYLTFDIETVSQGGMPDPSRRSDEVVIIAMEDSGEHGTFALVQEESEERLLRRFIGAVQAIDPDALVGHNVHDFDLDYLRRRCEMHGIEFDIGRRLPDGTRGQVSHYSSVKRAANRYLDYERHQVPGREILDTMFMAYDWNVFARALDSFGLKNIARALGYADEERTYVDGEEIPEMWEEDPRRLVEYALDDARETAEICDHFAATSFYQAQMQPIGFSTLTQVGTGRQVESMMVREYLRRRHSLPRREEKSDYRGAFTKLYVRGVLGISDEERVENADVSSLYPACQMRWERYPDGDVLGVMPTLLEGLTDMRLETKYKMRDLPDEDPQKAVLDARQQTYKIGINSFYGYLGWKHGLFNDMEQADNIVRDGEKVLRQMNSYIAEEGHDLVECDTDGTWYIPNGEGPAGEALAKKLTERLPEGIDIDLDASLPGFASYKTKNYVKQLPDGSIETVGSALTSSMFEQFGREFIRACFKDLLEGRIQQMHDRYVELIGRIRRREVPPARLAKRETLRESVEEYRRKVESETHGRTRDARYELAASRDGISTSMGTTVTYYVAEQDGEAPSRHAVKVYRDAKPITEYDGDENRLYYIRNRMRAFARKFEPFFREDDYERLFPCPPARSMEVGREDVSGVAPVRRQVGVVEDFQADFT